MTNQIIILILLFGFTTYNNDCSHLKNGMFSTRNPDGSETIITRKNNKQIENFENGERISEFDVLWTSDCEYLIFNRKVIKGTDPWPQMNQDTLKITITEFDKNFYWTDSEMLSKGWKMKQKIKILND